MKWSYSEPSYGDMIRVAIGSIYHFGIYVSDDEVIQFGLPPSMRSNLLDADVEVLASDIDAFLAGGFLEVCEFDKKEKKKNRTPDETVRYARSKIGTRGYHILYNNCEHFANECISGVQICRQAEDVRALFRQIPIVDVYIASVPEDCEIGDLECKARMQEVSSVKNEVLKRDKYFVWKLLYYALERSFGIRGEKLKFKKESYGGWSVENAEFSLSHCDGVLAVAVSRTPIGIDIERVKIPYKDKMAEYIMNDAELELFSALPEDQKAERLFEVWTAKEAIFKSKKINTFIPKDNDTVSASLKTNNVVINGEKYMWSVATSTPDRTRVFTDIDLGNIK